MRETPNVCKFIGMEYNSNQNPLVGDIYWLCITVLDQPMDVLWARNELFAAFSGITKSLTAATFII